MPRESEQTLSEKTKVPLGFLILCVSCCVAGAVSFYKVQVGQENILREIGEFKKSVWTRAEHRDFADEMREANSKLGLIVPHISLESRKVSQGEIRDSAAAEIRNNVIP